MYSACLYKVYVKKDNDTDNTLDNVFFDTEVLNEYSLREFFREQLDLGYLHPDNLEECDISTQDNPMVLDIDAIFECLTNNIDYVQENPKQYKTYYIEQFDVRLGDEDIYD